MEYNKSVQSSVTIFVSSPHFVPPGSVAGVTDIYAAVAQLVERIEASQVRVLPAVHIKPYTGRAVDSPKRLRSKGHGAPASPAGRKMGNRFGDQIIGTH